MMIHLSVITIFSTCFSQDPCVCPISSSETIHELLEESEFPPFFLFFCLIWKNNFNSSLGYVSWFQVLANATITITTDMFSNFRHNISLIYNIIMSLWFIGVTDPNIQFLLSPHCHNLILLRNCKPESPPNALMLCNCWHCTMVLRHYVSSRNIIFIKSLYTICIKRCTLNMLKEIIKMISSRYVFPGGIEVEIKMAANLY